jgi:GAF domain-containing protein
LAANRKARSAAAAAPARQKSAPFTDTERAQFQEMELLLNLSKQVAAIETLDELLATIVEITARETGADRGTLFLNDDQTGELYSRVAQGVHIREIRILNTRGTAGQVFTTRKGVIVHDPTTIRISIPRSTKRPGYITKNILAAPIFTARGEVIGVLQMLNKVEGKFTPEDLRRLKAMADQTALTLRNTQFREKMTAAREQEMRLLRRGLRRHRRIRPGHHAGENRRRGRQDAACRARHHLPQRFQNQRTVFARGDGRQDRRDPHAQPCGHRRRGVLLRKNHQHPARLRRPALQSSVR